MVWYLLALLYCFAGAHAQGNGIICDGGFELSNGCWYNANANVNSLISDTNYLQGGFGAWMGGISGPSIETLVQDITIPVQPPSRSVFLQLYLRAAFTKTTLQNYFSVSIDNRILFTVTAQNYTNYIGYYIPVTLDISSFADGLQHSVTFLSNSFNYQSSEDYSSFWVDDVSVIYRPAALYERDVYVSATGDDTTADGTQANPFRTIQMAVWAVSNNFTVWVNAGSYTGEINTCGKGIKVMATGTVNLAGRFMCSTVPSKFTKSYGGNLVINGFTFRNAPRSMGGALGVGWRTSASVSNSIFLQTTSDYGGAAFVQDLGFLYSRNCVYQQTSTTTGVGAIMVLLGGLNSDGDTFSGVSAEYTVIFVGPKNSVTFTSATFIDNACANAIINVGVNSNITISNSVFDGNNGTMLFVNHTSVDISNTIFNNNTAVNTFNVDFGLIFLQFGNAIFTNCTFSDNSVVNGFVVIGRGTNSDDNYDVTFSRSKFYGNTASLYIIAQTQFTMWFEDSSMWDNSGVPIYSFSSYVLVNRSRFEGDSNPLIQIEYSKLARIDNSEFANGAGIAVGIFYDATLLVTNTTFTNLASALLSTGGAFSSLSNCKITSLTGYAFSTQDLAQTFLDNIYIANNTASTSLISTLNATLSIKNSILTENTLESVIFSTTRQSRIYMENIQFIKNESPDLINTINSIIFASNITVIDHPLSVAAKLIEGIGSFSNCHFANCRAGIVSTSSLQLNLSNSLSENFRTQASYVGVLEIFNTPTYIQNCTFQNNARAAVSASFSEIKIKDSSIMHNYATLLISVNRCNISLSSSVFANNQLGQAIFMLGPTVVGVVESTVFDNNFSLLGPVVAVILGVGRFTNCSFLRSNSLLDVGSFGISGKAYFTNCTIANPIGGVGFLYSGSYAIFTNCSIDMNTIFHSHKLGPLIVSGSTVEIVNSHLFGGTDAAQGGILIITGSLSIRDSTFSNNDFSSSVIFANNATINVERSTFISNNGAAGSVYYGSDRASATFTSCNFTGNSAMSTQSNPWKNTKRDSTGGVFCVLDGSLTVSSSSVVNNYCASNGGVLFASGNTTSIKFVNSNFVNNTAGLGGAISWILVPTPNPSYEGCTFSNNTAVYGEVSASPPVQLAIDYPDTINSGVTFPLSVAVTDVLSQIVETSLPLFSVIVQRNDTGEVVLSQQANGNLGQLKFALNLTGNVGSEYDVLVRSLEDPVLFNGSYQMYSLKIQNCIAGSVLNEANTCVACRAGTADWGGTCQECPDSAVCPGGAGIFAQRGWWVPPTVDFTQHPKITVFPCDPSICKFNSCRSDNTGILCGECNPGYSKMRIYCNKCTGAEGAKVFFYLLFCLLCAFTLSYYVLPSTHVFLSLYYVLNTIAVLGQFNPDFAIIPLAQFNVDFWPKGCIGDINFADKFLIATLIVLLFVLPISLTNVANFILRKISSRLAPKEKSANFVQKLISNLITLYPPLCFFAFHMFSHVEVNNVDYLSIDPTVKSTSIIYKAALAFAILYTLIGFGLLLAIIILHKKTILEPLTAKYKDNFKFWDAIVLLRIIAVTTFFASFPSHPQIRTIIVVLVLCAFTLLHAFAKPYENAVRNRAETIAQSCACVCALLVNSHIITVRSPVTVGVLLTIISFATFAIWPLTKLLSSRKVLV